MKKLNSIFLMLLVVLTVSSCSESLLEKDPIGDFSSEDYLTTEEEALSAIIGIYDALQSSYNGNGWNSEFLAYNILGDDINAGGGSATDQSQLQAFDNYSQSTDNPAVSAFFSDYYKIVSSANAILATVSDDLSNSDQIKGEALFFRAFAYFHLVRLWGAVPYYSTNPTALTEGIAKTDAATVYSYIEEDLKAAAGLLSKKSELPEGEKFRISIGAAQALLGKVYLYQEKYTESYQAFESVISSPDHDLEDNYTEIWDIEKRAGVESIFEILYTSTNSVDWGGPWDGTAESNFIVELSGPRGDNSFNNIGDVNAFFLAKQEANDADYEYKITDLRNGWGFCVPTKKIGDLIYANAGQERIDGSIISESDFEAAGGEVNDPDNSTSPGSFNWNAYEGYIRLKWATRQTHTSPDGVSDLNFQTPFKLIRYADVLLMAAEAYNKAGKDTEAKAEIKKVRARAGFTNFSDFEGLSGDDLFEYIVKERVNELSFEGHRFFDLVRWGKAAAELPGFQAGKSELFPIPQSEFDLNSELGPEDQNPGY